MARQNLDVYPKAACEKKLGNSVDRMGRTLRKKDVQFCTDWICVPALICPEQVDMRQETGFLFLGAMVGAAVALLYSPQIDASTIRNIKKAAWKPSYWLYGPQGNIPGKVAIPADDMTKVVTDGVVCAKKLNADGHLFIPIFPAIAQRATGLSTENVK